MSRKLTFPALPCQVEGKKLILTLGMDQVYSVMALGMSGFLKVTLEKPGKPRTTGENSQNHRINGFCQQIAMATGNDFDTVKIAMKKMAISRGYPFDSFNGEIVPWSETRLDTIQAGILIDQIEQFAEEYGIRLEE